MLPREGRVIVYRRAWLWYGECPACPGEDNRIRSPFLTNTHRRAMDHVKSHQVGVA